MSEYFLLIGLVVTTFLIVVPLFMTNHQLKISFYKLAFFSWLIGFAGFLINSN